MSFAPSLTPSALERPHCGAATKEVVSGVGMVIEECFVVAILVLQICRVVSLMLGHEFSLQHVLKFPF